MPRTGKVLQLNEFIFPDVLGIRIAEKYTEWFNYLSKKRTDWKELYSYLYATDTTTTSNQSNPWMNTTTTPKLTQIADNLYANYMASLFPNRRWLKWEGANEASEDKADAILAYMNYVIEQPEFKNVVGNLVLDYIHNGNVFAMPEWMDERVEQDTQIQVGYVGPAAVRISPNDIVFNPTAPSFTSAPKIVRSIVSLGDVRALLDQLSTSEGDKKANEELYTYLKDIRLRVSTYQGELAAEDAYFQMDGFTSFRNYLESGYAEILTFYGDIYERETDKYYKNHIIQVVDRHKIIRKTPNPSVFGYAPIFHAGWRPRQDNLWAMGPLENLVGLQYRLDHIENLKADFFDIVYAPPMKITGYVEDFTWKPYEKIYVGDDGNVELLTSQLNPLQANFELDRLEFKMEEMAGAPKEAMGFRSPGEKTAFEVQQLANAANRIFQTKIAMFEEQILEPLLNSMLELARRNMDETIVRVIDDEYKVANFLSITADDITGAGRLRPVAARHFIEVAQRVQNITQFFGSPVGMDPAVNVHMSGIELARLFEELLDLKEFKLVEPFIRMTEQAEAQQLALQHEEDTMVGIQTPSGLTPEDTDEPFV